MSLRLTASGSRLNNSRNVQRKSSGDSRSNRRGHGLSSGWNNSQAAVGAVDDATGCGTVQCCSYVLYECDRIWQVCAAAAPISPWNLWTCWVHPLKMPQNSAQLRMEHLFTNDTPAYIDRPVNPAGLNSSPPCSHLPGKNNCPWCAVLYSFFQLYFSVLLQPFSCRAGTC